MLAPRLISVSCLVSALAGCSSDSSSNAATDTPAQVFIESVFTTATRSSVAEPPNRAPLDPIELPCDGLLGADLRSIGWAAHAPGGCGSATGCGHSIVKLSHGDLTQSASIVSSPALFTLTPVADWIGTSTLSVELVRDDDTPYPNATTPTTDHVDVTLTAAECPVTSTGEGGAGGSSAAP